MDRLILKLCWQSRVQSALDDRQQGGAQLENADAMSRTADTRDEGAVQVMTMPFEVGYWDRTTNLWAGRS